MIRVLIFTLILLLGFTVVVRNTEQTVVLQYFFGLATPPLPVYQLVSGAFIAGMLLAGLLIFPEWIRMRLEIRRQRKSLQRIEDEMARLRPPSPAMSSKHRESATEGEES
ncbi:MAG: LapA family protein [Nitrospirae bacterium]|nr:LapA family protein [Nitrospirota bacterium]